MWKSTVELGYLRHPETTSRRFDFHTGAEATKGGGGAGICAKDLAEQDVVLMNFETLENDLGQEKFASPLLHVQWWRMMTDEAQMCKTGGPEMAVELAKINRWAVTGTPLSSSFDDLVSQLYFIELEPFMTVKPKDVPSCVEIKILRRVRAESSRRPARHRRDACSMAWRCRFLTARQAPDTLVDFHTGDSGR